MADASETVHVGLLHHPFFPFAFREKRWVACPCGKYDSRLTDPKLMEGNERIEVFEGNLDVCCIDLLRCGETIAPTEYVNGQWLCEIHAQRRRK